ncbi:polysaccharide deacetylase family protein [Streptomyces sp. YIM S03343]
MTPRRPLTAPTLLLTLLLLLPLTSCAQSVDPIERLGKKAAQRVDHPTAHAVPGAGLPPYRRWGLPAPLTRPPKPSAAPPARTAGPGLPPALDHIPTRDRVVFLTYDYDTSAHRDPRYPRDPRFPDMVRDLHLPVTVFVTGTPADTDHAEFTRLRAAGAAVQNRTLDHHPLRGLPYRTQHTRICAEQDRLRARLNTHARFLRPPHGTYDTTTLRAAADCGVGALILWRATLTKTTLTYTRGAPHLHPGDIVRIPPRSPGTRTTSLLRKLQTEGLTAGRLEDYL